MINPYNAAVFRVWSPTEFGDVYDDYTRQEAINLINKEREVNNKPTLVDEDAIVEFFTIHWPEPLVYKNHKLVSAYNGLPPFDPNTPVKGKKGEQLELTLDTTGDDDCQP